MKTFGQLPRTRFTPPKQNRGGGWNPDKKIEAPLTGKIQEMKAAMGEERLSRVLNKSIGKGLVRDYRFRWTTLRRGVVGYKELDFLVTKTNGEVVAMSVKGRAFVHFGTKAKEQDKINELLILEKLRSLGYNAPGVTTIYDDELATPELAEKAAKKVGLFR